MSYQTQEAKSYDEPEPHGSGISDQIMRFENVAHRLAGVVEQLTDRLGPVLSPETPSKVSDEVRNNLRRSQIAEILENHIQTVEVNVERIYTLLSRLDV